MAGSISTKLGDKGQTSLIGGARVSKADLRVEAYGAIDELNSALGLARSFSDDAEVVEATRAIQKELFVVGGAMASLADDKQLATRTPKQSPPVVTTEMVEALTAQVHRIETMPGILSDWSVPGDHTAAAAYDVARTICRRAERLAVRLSEAGSAVDPNLLAYLNRLSDLLWLFARLLEMRAGVDSRLRDDQHKGPRWSRAW